MNGIMNVKEDVSIAGERDVEHPLCYGGKVQVMISYIKERNK